MKVYFLMRYFSKREKKSCFSPENFDHVLEFVKWKQKTLRPGAFQVNGYCVEVSQEDELLFKTKEGHYTLFKVTREDGITIMAVKHGDALVRKADNAFCELFKKSIFHPMLPDDR